MVSKKIIAFAGKGGVGKTSLSALSVKLLAEKYPDAKILAIDADPAVGLATALGVHVTHTVDDIRMKFINTLENGRKTEAIEVLNEAHYEITDSIVETDKFAFLAIGRPEGAGCYCKVNSFLKDIISQLSESFDYIVIDGEAGIEQVNRRVMEKVTHLVLVSDASRKGLNVIQTIHRVADQLCMYEKTGVILNRMKNDSIKHLIQVENLPIFGFLPEDEMLAMYDIEGKSLVQLDENTSGNLLATLKEALIQADIL